MALHILETSYALVEELRPLIQRIVRKDRSLADQLRRAASSIALNLAEGEHLDAGNQRQRFLTALGSANESQAALRVAVAWRYITPSEAEAARALLCRLIGTLVRLARR